MTFLEPQDERSIDASPIRLLLVEDDTLVRQMVRGFLEPYPNIEVVGEADDGAEALTKVEMLKPTVVVMDIVMPKMDGVAATRAINAHYPHTAVVGLSQNPTGYNVFAMVVAGAHDVIVKGAIGKLYGAIQRAAASVQPPPANC